MTHDVRYVDANDSFCSTCSRTIPNAHARWHREHGPLSP